MDLRRGLVTVRRELGLIILLCFLLSSPVLIYGNICQSICDCHAIDEDYFVHCSRKSLTVIPDDVPRNTTDLDMSFNNVTSVIASDVIFPRLRRLDLRGSRVHAITSGAFKRMPGLREIDLDHNKVEIIQENTFAGLPNLTILTLDHNSLRQLTNFAFQGLRTERLNLQHNENLTEIQDSAFWNSSVKTLILDRCKLPSISSMAFESLKLNLKSLMLSNNQVRLTLPDDIFSGFDMDLLHLSNNSLANIRFLRASTLTVKEVLLENNLLDVFDLSLYHGLSKTETLDVKNTTLTKLLRSTSLVTMSNLKVFDLSHNSLTFLHQTLFEGIDSLERLYLQYNPLTTVPEAMMSLVIGLEHVDMTGVPLSCDCRLEWLRQVIHRDNGTFITGARCNYPTRAPLSDSLLPFSCEPPGDINLKATYGTSASLRVACEATGNPKPEVSWSVIDSDRTVQVKKEGSHEELNSLQLKGEDCHILRCLATNFAGNASKYFYSGSCRQSPGRPSPSRLSPSYNKNSLVIGLCVAVLVIISAVFVGLLVKYRTRLQSKCARHSSRTFAARCTLGSEVNLLPNERNPSVEDPCPIWN